MARVYVGTYGKYNNGSIAGEWIDLSKFKSYDDFVAECRKVHKDERDPEFMIQDCDSFPDGLECGEWISEKEFNDVIQALKEDTKFDIIDYSEKAIAVIGDTREIKDKLKEMGGKFNPRLSCGAGWVFSKKQEQKVRNCLNCSKDVNSTVDETENLIGEYLQEISKAWNGDMLEYFRKKVSSLCRLSNGGILSFEKPKIETSFCFGYSDSAYDTDDYDNANKMAHHAATSEEYFLEQNLRVYDDEIKALEDNKEDNMHLCVTRESYFSQKEPLNVWNYKLLTWWQYRDAKERNYYTDLQEVGDADREIIINALKKERAKFEKRLRAYLKRYGLSKVKSWSYWRDA